MVGEGAGPYALHHGYGANPEVKYGVADTMAARHSSPDFSSGRRVDPVDDELVSAALGAPVGVART